jgi:hypothetical protein
LLRHIPLSHRSHIIGFQPIATGTTEHESALERDFVTLTSFLHPQVSILSQPITLRFSEDSKPRRYTPDYLVRYSADRAELIEIKYRQDLRANFPLLKDGFVIARDWAREQGITFRIVTERSIRGPTLDHAKRLLPLRRAPVDARLADLALKTIGTSSGMTFGDVLAALPVEREIGLATLWRLIAQRVLRVDFTMPITYASQVFLT